MVRLHGTIVNTHYCTLICIFPLTPLALVSSRCRADMIGLLHLLLTLLVPHLICIGVLGLFPAPSPPASDNLSSFGLPRHSAVVVSSVPSPQPACVPLYLVSRLLRCITPSSHLASSSLPFLLLSCLLRCSFSHLIHISQQNTGRRANCPRRGAYKVKGPAWKVL